MLAGDRPAAPGRGAGRRLALACLLVGAAVLAVHWPVLGSRAVAPDDEEYVTFNPYVSRPGASSVVRLFGEVLEPSSVRGYYQPLSMTSLMLDYAAGGRTSDPRAFHRTSLVLHAVNAVLVVLILHGLLGAVVPALALGLAFALHPVTVEPVVWVAERKALLAGMFCFASILLYLRYCGGKGRRWLPGSVGCFALALISKPTATPLPLLLLLLDGWPLQRFDRRAVVEKWPFFLLALMSGGVTLLSQGRLGGIAAAEHGDLGRGALQGGYVLALYLRNLVWPVRLTSIYPRPDPLALSNPEVLASVLAVVALTVSLVALARRSRAPLFGWLFLVAGLAPTLVLGVVKYSWVIAFDNYLYLPLLGILAVLGAGFARLWQRPKPLGGAARPVAIVAALVVLAAEARASRATLARWSDSWTLFRYMVSLAPDSPVIHNRLGILYAARPDPEAATRELRRAIELEPAYGDAHYNLGIVLGQEGRLAESIDHFRTAVELMPAYPEAAFNLGAALRHAGQMEEAESRFQRAVALKPEYVEALDQLGSVLTLRGRAAEAVGPLRAALALAPADPVREFRLGAALSMLAGHAREAKTLLERAIDLRPDWPEPINALAWLLATSPDSAVRDPAASLRLAVRAVELTRGLSAAVLDTRAAAEAAGGRFDEAVATARSALTLARAARDSGLSVAISARIELYRRGRVYLEPGVAGAKPID